MTYKLGSLFDGSGGFPLAATLCGVEPVWAAEVEPYPIAVTRTHFPNMKHLGDVCKVNGAEIEPVDIITFGSPCQDLSISGKREGLKHEAKGDEETNRSGLFMEAVRIIKEMRGATNGKYPTFALWENVPGAFSSNKGEDFRTVLEELIKIAEPDAVMPAVPPRGWPYADSYVGDGWSLAYRVFDAQFWGVPQRRRRIHLVVDFAGGRAQRVLFEREGLRGYPAPGGAEGESPSSDAENRAGADDSAGDGGGRLAAVAYTLEERSGCAGGGKGALVQEDISPPLRSTYHPYLFQPLIDKNILDDQRGQQINVRTDGKSPTLRAEMHGNIPCVMQAAGFKAGQGARARSIGYKEEIAPSLAAEAGGNSVPSVCIKESRLFENHSQDTRYKGPVDVCPMLPAQIGTGGNNTPFVVESLPVFCLQGNGIDRADTAGCNGKGVKENICYTLNTVDRPAVAYSSGNGQTNQTFSKELAGTLNCTHDQQAVLYAPLLNGDSEVCYIVRRLTPTECARFQGFPDNWGTPEEKNSFTDEEYRFWLSVHDTYLAITGKKPKYMTPERLVKWYNKLHTPSSEYKMWGNGIALPPALYCMQGMIDALEEDDKWML